MSVPRGDVAEGKVPGSPPGGLIEVHPSDRPVMAGRFSFPRSASLLRKLIRASYCETFLYKLIDRAVREFRECARLPIHALKEDLTS